MTPARRSQTISEVKRQNVGEKTANRLIKRKIFRFLQNLINTSHFLYKL